MKQLWPAALLALMLPLQAAQVLKVTQEGAFIYTGPEGEEKVAVMSLDEEIHLLQKGSQRSKIKAEGGFVGWVDNAQVEYVVEEKGSVFNLDTMGITAWKDNPTAIYILDHTRQTPAMLLTRDFSHEIFEFVDRETIERRNDEN